MDARARRSLLMAVAVLYAALSVFYSAVWMYGVRRTQATAYLGVETRHSPGLALLDVTRVVPGSPAAAAGLQDGDQMATLEGHSLATLTLFTERVVRGQPGQPIRLDVLRGGDPRPRRLTAVLAAPPGDGAPPTLIAWVTGQILAAFPVLFLVVAIPVLFLRVDSRDAWLLALLFAGFIAGAPYQEAVVPQALRHATIGYKVFFYSLMPALFFYVFAVFPEPSPIDRRWPGLKTGWLAFGLAIAAPAAVWATVAGSREPLEAIARTMPQWSARWLGLPYSMGGFALGILSLAGNALRGTEQTRRRIRVILWGIALGTGPMVVVHGAAAIVGRNFYRLPFWAWALCVMALLLVPLSFAYAVLKHRVLEIPLLLRRSARYLMVQRGALGVLVLLGAGGTLAFADSLAGYLQPRTQAALPTAAMVGAAFGTLAIWTGNRLHRRVRARIDRAFFRSSYDARTVLEDLAERARLATSRADLAVLIDHHVQAALLPRSLTIALQMRDAPPLVEDERLRAALAMGRPVDLATQGALRAVLPPVLAEPPPDALVPLLGRDGALCGVIALGPRLSEEPYSREDKRLLASVAGQAGIALESIRLAEQVSERLEVERREAHELELAQKVQRRLLPQERPVVASLDYAGRCIQARAVGGDYFDFLDLGPGALAFVLADVSGKGFAAALLMAALQASLRSRSPEDLMDLPRQLKAVNHLLYRSSEISRYATLFIGLYDEARRWLVYANCGHNPPLVVRAAGGVERLMPTAPVVGLLEEWDCTTAIVELHPGDVLAVYTDGVVEAFSDHGEEFGEQRLVDALRARAATPVETMLDEVVAEVRGFSGAEQEDDLTLVLARVRG